MQTGVARFQFVNLAYVGVASERVGYAMVCAKQQSGAAYWEIHDRFLVNGSRAASRQQLIDFAGEIDLDADAFASCYDDPATKQAHNQIVREARSNGISYGPRVHVNGVSAGTTFEGIRRRVENATP